MGPYTVELAARKRLAKDICELTFTRPQNFQFIPGQYIRFHFQGLERDYTLVGARDDSRISICVERFENQGFLARLFKCKPGQRHEISGPYGHFIYRPGRRPSVFVGTGTGVAPFAGFAASGVSGYILLQGARQSQDLIYRECLEKNSKTYVPCLSRDPGAASAFQGHVTQYLDQVLSRGEYRFYICGGRQMIQDAWAL
ncbi:MAG: hypothetical protein HUN05_18320 [Desulfobacter sp.]|nr:MAG: hypothetical protein HUN05_18320 [Desulfobacter sp.]